MEKTIEDDFIIGLIMNTLSVGGFKSPVSKDVRLDDGLFEVLLVRMPKNIIELQSIIVALLNQNMDNEMMIYEQTGSMRIYSEAMGWSSGRRSLEALQNMLKYRIANVRSELFAEKIY